MTEITVTAKDNHYRLEAEYHADDSRICAGISAILYALEGALINNADVKVHYSKLEPGHAVIEYLSAADTAEEDMRMALIGLLQIEKSHPDSIKIVQDMFA